MLRVRCTTTHTHTHTYTPPLCLRRYGASRASLRTAANDPRLQSLTGAPLLEGYVLEALDPDTAAIASASATSSAITSSAIKPTDGAVLAAVSPNEQPTGTLQSGKGGHTGVKGREKL